ncbi:hypothetical protein Syun_026377 [Stephania yunnanensis]|uniref:Transposase Tnp1/En/Spm-like domain-containing protein n=1 Tax=Stephania yunnanensis TaxID=152371 RepID=A0AAP0EYT5_9MAGN
MMLNRCKVFENYGKSSKNKGDLATFVNKAIKLRKLEQSKRFSIRQVEKDMLALNMRWQIEEKDGASVSRAEVWIRGHSDKNEKPHNAEIAEIVDKINACNQSQCSESTAQSINNDPISQVFGTEHQGRVRGLGFGVTPTGVGATTQNNAIIKELIGLREKYEDLSSYVYNQYKQGQLGGDGHTCTCQPQNGNSSNKCGMKCKLIDWVVGTHIVAEGEIAIDDPLHVVEGAPIGVGSYMVWVQTAIDHNALIWRTQANMRTIEQALGESIPWPKQHVFIPNT